MSIRLYTGRDTPSANGSKLTVQQFLEIKSCKDYVKTPLQKLDGIYINQPKRFLSLAKEVKKLVEEF